MLRIRALGGLSIDLGEAAFGPAASQRKPLALLALLAAAGSRGMSRDRIVACLWAESAAEKASHRLTQLLYLLRRDLQVEDPFLGSIELRLNPAVITSDLAEFTTAMEAGDFSRAALVYGGPFLDGFYLGDGPEFERWVDGERTRLAERWTSAAERLAQEAGRRADLPTAAGWWRQLTRADPLNPRFAETYLESLAAMGDRAGALRFAQSYEALLEVEFDAKPARSVQQAVERLRNTTQERPASPAPPAIAVIPLVNLTPDQENEYFSDGMTDEIITALARIPGLRVASRISSFAFKGKEVEPREIAERLGVSLLVEGTVRKVGSRIRLTAQLVNPADGCELWSQTYDRTLDDIFALQEELSGAIVDALPLTSGTRPPFRGQPTPLPEAFTFALRGRYAARKRTIQSLELAIEYFEQAVELDPDYAAAHAGLAECWVMKGFPEFGAVSPLEAMPRAKAAVHEALRLDPRLADAHTHLGTIHLLFDWDWPAAEEAFRRAIQLEPNNYYGHLWYAVLLGSQRRSEESLRRIRYAETLENFSMQGSLVVGRCYFWARRYQQAVEHFREMLRADPGSSPVVDWLVRTLCTSGRGSEALDEIENVAPDQRSPVLNAYAPYALALLGRTKEAQDLCQSLLRQSPPYALFPYTLGAVRALLGENEAAIDALESAVRARSSFVPFMLTEPALDRLHDQPRFRALREELRLPATTPLPRAPSSSPA